jgi:hypothetical protein
MRRSLALLVISMLLYVSSPLAATRHNRVYEELQRKYEAALQEIERLRSALTTLKGEQTAGLSPVTPQAKGAPSGDFLQTGRLSTGRQRFCACGAVRYGAGAPTPPGAPRRSRQVQERLRSAG